MEDLIRRSDAIKAVKRISENYGGKGKRDYHPHIDFIVDELMYALPSADRPQGEWVRYMGDIWTCSACGESLMCDDIECNNYCPNCGADMRGAEDE